MAVILFILLLLSGWASAVEFPCSGHHYPFCNTSLPSGERAHSLVSLLTLPEKITQLCNNASAIPRLGIPPYQWWSESLHGIATNGPGVSFGGDFPAATNFPQVLVMASSFSRALWRSVGAAVAREGRAMYNGGRAGLTFWAPNVNLFRDPRWGRGQETPGEDPMLASSFAVQFVDAFQRGDRPEHHGIINILDHHHNDEDEDEDELMLSACCKHLTAYDLDKWGSFARYNFNAVITDQDFEDMYQPPFRSCVEEGKASCLMCSYNEVNGVPACARKDLFDQARNQWGFKGYVTSDCDAVATVNDYQYYTNNPEDAVADVLKAGIDINCGTYLLRHTLSAVQQGEVQEEDIDRALFNLFSVQIRLGLFNGDPRKGKYGSLGPRDVCTSDHKKLALEVARNGIVLLKNHNKFMPLKKDAISSLAVIGPLANDSSKLSGSYSGLPCSSKSLLDGFQEFVKETSYASGCLNVTCDSDDGFEEAIEIAKEADYVVMILGIDLTQETEDHDRVSLLLPGNQAVLVSSVVAVSKNPVILVLTGGGPLDVSFADKHPRVASILWIGYPGETGGQALAEIVFGQVNPSGRLAMTWYPESFTNVPMNDMRMRADPTRGYPGRTYRFYNGHSVYAFGQGLSYTNYTYTFLSLPDKLSLSGSSFNTGAGRHDLHQVGERLEFMFVEELTCCEALRFAVDIEVTNIGEVDGSHVVMLFSRPPKSVKGAPMKVLIGFEKVNIISSKRSTTTSIIVDPCRHLSFANEEGKRVLSLGHHVFMLGELEHSLFIQP